MIDIGIVSAFIGGLLTFFAPCTLPLVPAYLGFIGGVNARARTLPDDPIRERLALFLYALFFVAGFTVIFVSYGLLSGAIGAALLVHKDLFARLGGVVIALFGFSLLDVFPVGKLLKGFARPLPSWIRTGTPGGAFLLGFLFALGWSPCLGPILGSILVLAATASHAAEGALLLAVYSVGLGIPFLILAALYGEAFAHIRRIAKFVPYAANAGAWMLVVLGIAIAWGGLASIGALLGGVIPYENFINYM